MDNPRLAIMLHLSEEEHIMEELIDGFNTTLWVFIRMNKRVKDVLSDPISPTNEVVDDGLT